MHSECNSPGVLLLLLLLLSHFSHVYATPQMAAHQALPSLGFSRQEYWSRLPFPSPMHQSESESEVAQSCPTLSDPMDCSPPGSPVHGIFQARVPEWGAIAFSNCKHRAVTESTTSRLSSHTLLSRRPQTSQPMSSVCHIQKGVSTWSSPPRPTRKSMYGCEGWTIKEAECQRIDAFQLRCWRRLLRVPWTARRSNQSILKETSPECSLEGLILMLKLQYFGLLMRRTDSLEKILMLGKMEGRRRRG